MAQEWGLRPWDLEREIEGNPALDLWIERKTLWDNAMANRQQEEIKPSGVTESTRGSMTTKKTVVR